jgi:hypothetical protein
MASINSQQTTAAVEASAPAPPVVTVTYQVGRIRLAILKGDGSGEVDIARTYGDIFEATDERTARCNLCARMAKLIGEKMKTEFATVGKSSNMLSHIALVHPQELTDVCAAKTAVKDVLGKMVKPLKAGATVEAPPAMEAFLSRGPPPGFDLTTEFAFIALTDARPFHMFKGRGFNTFFDKARLLSYFKTGVPSPQTIARRAVLIDEAVQMHLADFVFPGELGYTDSTDDEVLARTRSENFTLFSASCDGWQSVSGIPTLGATVHYITPSWHLRDVAVVVRKFPPPHTGKAYAQLFGAALDEYNLPIEHMLSLTTDGAANMLKMAEELMTPHLRCVDHALHNAVQTDVFKSDEFKGVFTAPIELGNFFSSIATTRNEVARLLAVKMGVPEPRKVVAVVDTRWHSLHAALEAHIERWPVIQFVTSKMIGLTGDQAAEYDSLRKTCKNSYEALVEVVKMLKPTVLWGRLLEASNSPTLPLVYTAREQILAALDDIELEEAIPVSNKLRESLIARLEVIAPTEDPGAGGDQKARTRFKMMQTAAVLDVRTAAAHMQKTSKQTAEVIIDYMANCHATFRPEPVQASAGSSSSVAAAAVVDDAFMDAIGGKEGSSVLEASRQGILSELVSYRFEVKALTAGMSLAELLKLDSLAWWGQNAAKYPHLARVARSLLAVPASSASSERLFSSAGLVSSGLRARMSADMLELCALTRSAIKEGFDVRELVARLIKAKAEAANKKRSATMVLRHAAKRMRQWTRAPTSAPSQGVEGAAVAAVPAAAVPAAAVPAAAAAPASGGAAVSAVAPSSGDAGAGAAVEVVSDDEEIDCSAAAPAGLTDLERAVELRVAALLLDSEEAYAPEVV